MRPDRPADLVVLHALTRAPATRRTLAEDTGMSMGYMHVTLARLESAGKIRKTGRVCCIGLGKGGTPTIWEIVR